MRQQTAKPAGLAAIAATLLAYRDLWLRALLAVFAFSLLLRLADRLALAARLPSHLDRARRFLAPEEMTETLPHAAPLTAETAARLAARVRSARISIEGEGDDAVLRVERLRLAAWGDWLLGRVLRRSHR